MAEWNAVPRALKVSALLFAIVALFYWRLTLTDQYDWMWSPDMAGQVLPWFQAQALQWHRHGLPMWDQYLWTGQPLFGQAQPGAAYPLNWLLFWTPLDAEGHIRPIALSCYYVAIHLMAAAFCYKLCRDLGRSIAASICGAMIFTFAGYVGRTDWPQMLNGAVWMPLVFLYALRAGAGKRPLANGALAGLFLGMAWLSGHHQVVMFTTLAFAGTWMFFALRESRIDWRIARAAAVSLVVTGLVGAFQILPALEYGHLAKRWAGSPEPLSWNQPVPYYVHEKYSMEPPGFFGIVFAGANDGNAPYVGIVALMLAALGIAACWKDGRVRVLASIGLGGIVYALGGLSVFQGALYGLVPSLDKARAPLVASALFGFAIAVLAAFGIDRWRAEEPTPWVRKIALSSAGFGAVTFAVSLAALFFNKLSWQGNPRPPLDIFIPLALSALLFALPARNLSLRSATVLAALLLVFDLYQGSSNLAFAARTSPNRAHFIDDTRGNGDIAGFLHGRLGIQRTDIANDAFLANWGAYWDVPVWEGYLASVTENVLQFANHTANTRKLWGVAYSVASAPTPYASQEIFAGSSGMKLYWQPNAFPRAWAVHHITRIESSNQLNWYVENRLDLLHSEGLMYDTPPPLAPCSNGQDDVQLKEAQGSRVRISARLACEGMVVVSDTYYPGWRAWVDGKPAPIYPLDGAMRGVVVPAGQHLITMRYRPPVLYEGAALSLLGIAAAIVLAWNKRL